MRGVVEGGRSEAQVVVRKMFLGRIKGRYGDEGWVKGTKDRRREVKQSPRCFRTREGATEVEGKVE